MEFRILGPLEIVEHGRLLPAGGEKQRTMLALLLLHHGEVVAATRLIDALWGEEPPETAATALHGHVSRLRKLLPREALLTRAPGYLLRIEAGQLDLDQFEHLRAEASRAAADGVPVLAVERLREALSLWRGSALADVAEQHALRGEIARLEELRLTALEERIEAELALGLHKELVAELESLVAAHPFRERLHGQLMLALYRCGRQAEALHAYQETRRVLVGELGIEPGTALQLLERQILVQDEALAPPSRSPAPPPVASTPTPAKPAPTAPQEERKVISVLFVNLIGFSQRAERLDPEEVKALLAPFGACVRREIARFGGTVEKFIGGEVIAVFGAPVAHEDDPARAARAALAIRQAAAPLDLHVRAAVTTGEAIVAVEAAAGEALAVSDVVDTAARLCEAAPVDGVLVSERARRVTEHVFEYAPADLVHANGKREPVLAAELLRARPVPLPRPASREFVGRGRELELLDAALARAREDRALQLVTLAGPPGIGKSRLVAEFGARGHERGDVLWRQGRCLPYGEGVTLSALGEIVKAQTGALDGDTAEEAQRKLERAVAEALPDEREAAWVERHLRPLLGIGGALEGGAAEAFTAWRRFFEALAEHQPLVLVVEDLHWADDGLLDFLEHLAEWVDDVPLLVVATARSELLERRPAWGGGKRNVTTVTLPPLADAEAARIIAAVAGRQALGADAEAAVLERAGGIPLYAEEFALMLRDRAALDLPLPETVHGVIAARIDTLPREEKALLRSAAVVGKTFWLGALAAVAGENVDAISERLRALERKEFVRRVRSSQVADDGVYSFRHVLVRDVAYAQIPRARRAAAHRRAAEWLEALAPARLDDRVETLAHQYLAALELARAVGQPTAEFEPAARRALADAGDRAAALGAPAAAARFYEAALDLSPEDAPDRAQLLLRYGRARYAADETGEEELAEARDALLEAGDRASAAEAEATLAYVATRRARGDLALEHARRAAELVASTPPSASKAHVLAELAAAALGEDDAEAVRLGREALAMGERLALPDVCARVLNVIGIARVLAQGDRGGVEDLERSIDLGTQASSPESVRASINLAYVMHGLGDLERSRELRERAERLATRLGAEPFLRHLRIERMEDAYWSGAWEEALGAAEAILAEFASGAPHVMEIPERLVRGRIRVARGDAAGALDDVRRALELARAAKADAFLWPALATGARVLLATGAAAEASGAVDELLVSWAAVPAPAAGFWWPDLAAVLAGLARLDELDAAAARVKLPSRWLDAGLAYAQEDFARAAALFAEIGSQPDEADARLRLAGRLIAAGNRPEGEAELERALAFYRNVDASAYVELAEELLVARA